MQLTPKEKRELMAEISTMPPNQLQAFLREAPDDVKHLLQWDWEMKARPEQLIPPGKWAYWLILAGRGFGKTRTGAETVREWVKKYKYVNLVGATADDAKDIMIEGESGILEICPPDERPTYRKHERKLAWPNGATSLIFTADEPERLRGKQHMKLWCFPLNTLVLTNEGDRCISTVTIGDEVLTRAGWKPVINTASHIDTTGTIALDDGTELVGTGDHRVMTDRGWVQMQHLTEDDHVWKSTGYSNQTGISGRTSENATQTTKTAERLCISIGGFGNDTTGLFRQVIKSITSTATKLTTALKIWSALANPRILAYIGNFNQSLAPSSTSRARSLALTAGQPSFVSALTLGTPDAIAVTNVTGTANAPNTHSNAERAIPLTTASDEVKVIAVKVAQTWAEETSQRVYCLTVADQPEFFANTILAHNCDEIAAWRYPEAWDQAKFGLRLGDSPQAVISTTPRPTKMMREIIRDSKTHVTKGSTYDNKANLAGAFFDSIIDKYEGTRLGRQELNAEMLNDMPGALWRSENIEDQRRSEDDLPAGLQRIVVAVDPATSNDEGADETGIVVAGVGIDQNGQPRGYVLEDASGHYAPDEWARRAVSMYDKWAADRIVAEANQGGDMVALTLKSARATAPITLVKASRGKVTRAEPVAALYEQGRISHVGLFEELEDQMLSFTSDLDRKAFGRSPDRVDALVWAFTELFPRIIKTNTRKRASKYKPKQRFFA